MRNKRQTWSILIRTLQADRKADGVWKARLLAGGGLTIASVPSEEVHECKIKALAIAAAGWGLRGQEDIMGMMEGGRQGSERRVKGGNSEGGMDRGRMGG